MTHHIPQLHSISLLTIQVTIEFHITLALGTTIIDDNEKGGCVVLKEECQKIVKCWVVLPGFCNAEGSEGPVSNGREWKKTRDELRVEGDKSGVVLFTTASANVHGYLLDEWVRY